MTGGIPITVVGNLTDDPTLRYTASGAAVASFTVASTPRVFDQTSGQWRDGDPVFLRCNLWRQPAEHLVDSLGKGARVVLPGGYSNVATTLPTATSAPSWKSRPKNSAHRSGTPRSPSTRPAAQNPALIPVRTSGNTVRPPVVNRPSEADA
jgi:single-stranded DNA-binding protein